MSKTFFGREKSIGKLHIDAEATNAHSEEIQRRLGRIEENYGKLEFMLRDIESRLAGDSVYEIVEGVAMNEVDDLPRKPR